MPDVARSRLPVQRLRRPSRGFSDEALVGRDKRMLRPRDTANSLSTASTSSGQSSWAGVSEEQVASIQRLLSGGTIGRLRSVEPIDTPRCFDTVEDPTKVDEQPASRSANKCDHTDGSYLRGISKTCTLPWSATASGRGMTEAKPASGRGSAGSVGSGARENSWPEVVDCAQPVVIDCSPQSEAEAQRVTQQPCPLRRHSGGLLQVAPDHEAAPGPMGLMFGSGSTSRHASGSQSSRLESEEDWSGHVFSGSLASAHVPLKPAQSPGPTISWAAGGSVSAAAHQLHMSRFAQRQHPH